MNRDNNPFIFRFMRTSEYDDWTDDIPEGYQQETKIYSQPIDKGRKYKGRKAHFFKFISRTREGVYGPIPLPFKHKNIRWR